ncbi:hypothetical protein C0995_006627 [Termitomyces sp. Mi166|nr:hypothetical protein C0995_006627 [Termitomyces sp. Mi166\
MVAVRFHAPLLVFSLFTAIRVAKALNCAPIDDLRTSPGQLQDRELTANFVSLITEAEPFNPLTRNTATITGTQSTQSSRSFNPVPDRTITNGVSHPGITITTSIKVPFPFSNTAFATRIPTTDSNRSLDSVRTPITLTSSSHSTVVFTPSPTTPKRSHKRMESPATTMESPATTMESPATTMESPATTMESPPTTLVSTPTAFATVTLTSTAIPSVTTSNGAESHLVSGRTTAGIMGFLGVILTAF